MVGREAPISVSIGWSFLENKWTATSWRLKKGGHHSEIV